MIPKDIRKKLPRAKLFSIKIGGYYKKPYYTKFRCANFMRWQIGYICITHRMPWLEDSARKLHPHLFTDHRN
jgi:hypothetical protein